VLGAVLEGAPGVCGNGEDLYGGGGEAVIGALDRLDNVGGVPAPGGGATPDLGGVPGAPLPPDRCGDHLPWGCDC